MLCDALGALTTPPPIVCMQTDFLHVLNCFCGMWSGQWPGPEPAGSGRAWASNMTIVLRAGPGHTFFACRAS